MEGQIEITTREQAGQLWLILTFKGNVLEHEAEAAASQIEGYIRDTRRPRIVFVLADLHYVNSKVVGYMTSWYMMTSKNLGHAVFVSAQPNVYDLIETQGLLNYIPYFPNLEEATLALTS